MGAGAHHPAYQPKEVLMSGVRSITRRSSNPGFASSTSAPIRVDDSLSVLKMIPGGAGSTTERTIYDDGTGVPSARMIKYAVLALTGAAVHAGAVGIVNPEGASNVMLT